MLFAVLETFEIVFLNIVIAVKLGYSLKKKTSYEVIGIRSGLVGSCCPKFTPIIGLHHISPGLIHLIALLLQVFYIFES